MVITLTAFVLIAVIAMGILKALFSRPQWLIIVAVPVFWLQWAVTGRTFTYYYYFLDAYTFLTIAVAIALGKMQSNRFRAAIPAVLLATVWFVSHYPAFAAMSARWRVALDVIRF
jgi:hypothetical protein